MSCGSVRRGFPSSRASPRACGERLGNRQGGVAPAGTAGRGGSGPRSESLTTSECEELRRLRKENAELRRANAILKDASVYFATELDPTRRK
jgi:hypothetical protein